MKIILYGLPQEVSQILKEKLSFLRDDLVIVEEEGKLFELIVRFDSGACNKVVLVARSSYLLDHARGSSFWNTFDKVYEPGKKGCKVCLNFDEDDEQRQSAERESPFADHPPIQLMNQSYHLATNKDSWIDYLITQLLEQYFKLKQANLM